MKKIYAASLFALSAFLLNVGVAYAQFCPAGGAPPCKPLPGAGGGGGAGCSLALGHPSSGIALVALVLGMAFVATRRRTKG